MRLFPRPKIVISKCIEFDHCRYDGSLIPSDFVKALMPHVDFTPVCAEMEIGLGVPRSSIRIVSENDEIRLVQPTTGLDVTEKMRSFSSRFLDSLSGIDGFILKFRSPSCGIKDIRVYSGSAKSHTVSKTAGFFGGAVVKTFSCLAIEDEGRLRNFNIREHFLTKLYALSDLREVENAASVSELIKFHTANKLLLAAYSQKESKILGNIVANRENLAFPEQALLYRRHLAEALKRPPKYTSKANVLMHSLGYFSDKLSHEEKAYFLQNIERYKKKRIPFSALLAMLQSWIARFGEDYLRNQTFFEPFPEDLIELCRDTQCEWAGEELFLKSEMPPEGFLKL
jgi:uncharacterized protein YbgA (DUF1722 family)/uncharacterized protein YbbK (DUF523 family)